MILRGSSGSLYQNYLLDVVKLGSTGRQIQRFLGRQCAYGVRITEYEPARKVRFRSTSGIMRFEVSYMLEPLEKSTKSIWEMKAEQSAFFNPSDPVEVRIYKRQVEAGINNLKVFFSQVAEAIFSPNTPGLRYSLPGRNEGRYARLLKKRIVGHCAIFGISHCYMSLIS